MIGFLAASGVMAAVDAALLSVTEPEIHELILKRRRGSRQLRTVHRHLTRSLVVIVIVTNLVNVVGPIVVSQQAVAVWGTEVLGLITAILTLGTIVCSEIIPKSLGNRHAPVIGLYAAVPICWLQKLLYPLVLILEWFSARFARGKRRIGTEEQIRSLVTMGRRAGYIESDEGRLIHRAFILNDRAAADIMTPLSQVVSLPAEQSTRAAAAGLRKCRFSRLPVFGLDPDDVKGVVMARDILESALHDSPSATVADLAMPCIIVDAATSSDVLLSDFLAQHIHLAVVQKSDRTVGVVTLEDVLEELVGEIKDERDARKPTHPD